MKNYLIAFVIALTATISLKAQDFSGNYTIVSKEMIEGKEYLNAIAKGIAVIQTKDSLKITRITASGDNQVITTTESLALNGKSVETTTISKRKKSATVSFNKATNTATITYVFWYAEKPEEVEFRNTEVWTLKKDETLTIIKTSDATVSDDWKIKAVFRTN